jgi:hypothetical protein
VLFEENPCGVNRGGGKRMAARSSLKSGKGRTSRPLVVEAWVRPRGAAVQGAYQSSPAFVTSISLLPDGKFMIRSVLVLAVHAVAAVEVRQIGAEKLGPIHRDDQNGTIGNRVQVQGQARIVGQPGAEAEGHP